MASLSRGAESMFWRLTTVADDYGRFNADPEVLRSKCFEVTPKDLGEDDVLRWRDEMVSVGLIALYRAPEEPDREFGVFLRWGKYQRERGSRPKFPDPPEDISCLMAQAATCGDSRQPAATGGDSRQVAATRGSRARAFGIRDPGVEIRDPRDEGAPPPPAATGGDSRQPAAFDVGVGRVRDYFLASYRARMGTDPEWGDREAARARALVERATSEAVLGALQVFFGTDEAWIRDGGYGFLRFSGQSVFEACLRLAKTSPSKGGVNEQWARYFAEHPELKGGAP